MRVTCAEVGLADLHVLGERLDHLAGPLGASSPSGEAMKMRPSFSMSILDARVGDDLVDDLAAGSDDVLDLSPARS